MFVLAELLPMFRSRPERISAHPQAIIAFGQSGAELLVPTASDPLEIELVALKIPVAAGEQFDLPRPPIAVKTRNFATQGVLRLLLRNRVRDRPHARFGALQSRFEIASGCVEQVLGGFVEKADTPTAYRP